MRPQLPSLLGPCLAFVIACGPDPDDSSTGGTGTSGTTDMTSTTSTTSTDTTPTTGPATSGAESSATTDTPMPAGECMQDSDCVLVNDCCVCDSAPADVPIKPCEGNCLQSSCDALGLKDVQVACRLGVCEFADVTCSEGPVTCDEAKPSCPAGTRVSVQDNCWGPCVHPRYCADEACPAEGCGEGWTCVDYEAANSDCVVVPLECAGVPDCTCGAPYADELCQGNCVDDDMGAVRCQDGV